MSYDNWKSRKFEKVVKTCDCCGDTVGVNYSMYGVVYTNICKLLHIVKENTTAYQNEDLDHALVPVLDFMVKTIIGEDSMVVKSNHSTTLASFDPEPGDMAEAFDHQLRLYDDLNNGAEFYTDAGKVFEYAFDVLSVLYTLQTSSHAVDKAHRDYDCGYVIWGMQNIVCFFVGEKYSVERESYSVQFLN